VAEKSVVHILVFWKEGFAMKIWIPLLCAVLFCTGTSLAQLGANCGEHPNIFRNKSEIVWFRPDQMEKMAVRRIEFVMPRTGLPSHYHGFVSFKVLVDTKGDIGCIWAPVGNAICVRAVNEALQYWRYKPMLLDKTPVEYVGEVKFDIRSD
jgi:hypothetical protein